MVPLPTIGSTGAMSTLLAAVVRIVVMGAALGGYFAALPYLFSDDGDGANIGAGLIAFAGLMLVSFGWGFLDGRARGISPTVVVWAIVAAGVAVGWLVGLAVAEAGESMSVTDMIRTDLFSVFFTGGLILVPAAVGAAVGGSLRPSQVS